MTSIGGPAAAVPARMQSALAYGVVSSIKTKFVGARSGVELQEEDVLAAQTPMPLDMH
jgi:hypothetical protein